DRTVVEHMDERLERLGRAAFVMEQLDPQSHGTAFDPGPVIPAQRLRGRGPQPVVLAERQCLPSLDHRVPGTLRTHLVSQVLKGLRLPRGDQDEAGDVDDAGLPCALDTGHPYEAGSCTLRT